MMVWAKHSIRMHNLKVRKILRHLIKVVEGTGFQYRMFGCYGNCGYEKHCVVEHLRSSKTFIIRLVRGTLSSYADESQQ